MTEIARLLVPAIRWDADKGYHGQRDHIDRSLGAGVGGFILFGGESTAVAELTAELRDRSAFPLLIAADLERGAGQQFAGATGLPPLAAIGSSSESGAAARAGRITAKEALALGVNWVLAPVCDLDLEPDNPIIGTRSFGSGVERVSALVSEWIDGCQAAGAMACAKHFPGHGRTSVDSHAELPAVHTGAEALWESDVAPFRAAVEAGVASILTAHISYPSLDHSGAPATLSREILRGLLRVRLGFEGIIVTDAMIMEGVLQGESEERACLRAIAAGCDLILYPVDVISVVKALDRAQQSGELDGEEIRRSLARRERWATWGSVGGMAVPAEESAWARSFAVQCITEARGQLLSVSRRLDVLVVDDDVGGPYAPPSREPLLEELNRLGFDARRVEAPSMDGRRALIVAVFGDIRSWKGRAGYSAATVNAVARAIDRDPAAIVVQFSHPRLASQLPSAARNVVSAWGGERAMQEGAARWLDSRTGM